MANFDSVGAGASRGLLNAESIRNSRFQRNQLRRQAIEQQQVKRIEGFEASMTAQRERAEETFKELTGAATEIATLSANPTATDEQRAAAQEQLMQLERAAMASLMSHAQMLKYNRDTMRELGFPQEAIDLAPDPVEFIQQRFPLFQSQVEAAALAASQQPITENSFFAVVDGFGSRPVRVTERDTPNGTQLFVDDTPVKGSQVSKPIEQTQEVNTDFRIPGLTESQSGQELMAMGQQLAAVNTFSRLAQKVADDVQNRPEKIGTVGDVIRAFGSLTAQVEGLTNALSLDSAFVDKDGRPISRDEALKEFDFGELAGEAAEVKRTLLDLVFLDLAAKGQTGRAVSDRDLEIFRNETSIQSGDPQQVIQGLARGVENNQVQFRQNFKDRTRSAIAFEEFAPGGLVEFSNPLANTSEIASLVSRRDEAFASGDLDEAERLIQQIDALLNPKR